MNESSSFNKTDFQVDCAYESTAYFVFYLLALMATVVCGAFMVREELGSVLLLQIQTDSEIDC